MIPNNFYVRSHSWNDLDGLYFLAQSLTLYQSLWLMNMTHWRRWAHPVTSSSVLSFPFYHLVLTFHNHQKIISKLASHFEVCFDNFEVCTAIRPVLSMFHRSQKSWGKAKYILIWEVESCVDVFQKGLVVFLHILW